MSLLYFITLKLDTTLGRTPLVDGSARRRDLYLTTHDILLTAMPQPEFEPAVPASERPQNYTLDRAANWIGKIVVSVSKIRSRTAL